MSASFKIVVSQPTRTSPAANQAGSRALASSDSVCSATFIDLNKPVYRGGTVHISMSQNFQRKA